MREDYWYGLSPDTHAIVASNLVNAVILLRANRWREEDAKRSVARLYDEIRNELATGAIYHDGPPSS